MATTNTPIGRVLLKDVRLAFPNLFEPKPDDSGTLKFGAALILPLDHPQLAEIADRMDAVGKEKWGQHWATTKKGLEKQDRMALHDGDTKSKYDGFPGNFFINANTRENAPPTVIDRDRSPLSARSGRPYAGCFVNASIEFWAQKDHPKGGSRINAQLRGIQFLRDGDSFSAGRPADADEFDEVTEGADADEFA